MAFTRIDGSTDSCDRLLVPCFACQFFWFLDIYVEQQPTRMTISTICIANLQITQRFKNEPALRVALLSVTAAGTGLDFSAASLVVFAELPSEVKVKYST